MSYREQVGRVGRTNDRRVAWQRIVGFLASRGAGVWYSTVREGGCRVTVAWVKEEEKASEHR